MAVNKWCDLPAHVSGRHVQTKQFGQVTASQYKVLQDVSRPHVESFNYVLREGLGKALQHIQPLELELPNGDRFQMELTDCIIGKPVVHGDNALARTYKTFPSECRCRGVTYKGKLQIRISWSVNGRLMNAIERVIGEVPVMVKSKICNLNDLEPEELIKCGEELEEFGGYFIINGNERLVRMLIMQRRNYPIAMVRPTWKKAGNMFTDYGISVRCVRSDQTSSNIVLHYLSDGSAQLRFSYRKELFYVPVMLILKALCDETDHGIYRELMKGKEDDLFYKGCIASMLRKLQNNGLYTHEQIKSYIGKMFRVKINLPDWHSDSEVADYLLKCSICVHLESNYDKFTLLIFMIKKLFAVVKNECALETPDNPMNQEVMLSGHLFLIVIKEKLEAWLLSLQRLLEKKIKTKGKALKINERVMNECLSRAMNLTRPVEAVFATGTFLSKSENLMQSSGLTIVADKLNFWRYLSHFRAVHRGAYFASQRTTTVRKLLPEAWGFLCPVHTPDGAPCGLLNHMTAMCEVTNVQPPIKHLPEVLASLGMVPYLAPMLLSIKNCYCVFLDGRILGWVLNNVASELVNQLRYLKTVGDAKVPSTLEIVRVPMTKNASQYPGIFLFSSPSRMIRPVKNLNFNTVEHIGTMEQVYLNICVNSSEKYEETTTHQEINETSILSILANMIPFSDFNQSPRNMYECQMGKQTMGTPCHAFRYRSDNKLYRIQTPQSPLVRPTMYDYYHMDDYPLGTNAVIAVISYTGYDMEDAMVINKASLERGFKHGSIYKSEFINLRIIAGDSGAQTSFEFGKKENSKVPDYIDSDGLPCIGTRIEHNQPICSYIVKATGETKVEKYKSHETAYIHEVKILGNDGGTDLLQKICITFWIPRNPVIGDKFASRHGQKGICSLKMPIADMPFTESGMTPDIIFNPHGFPSRMTIGMVIETMAGKAAALYGTPYDSTPFKFSEENTAGELFGNLLQDAGYNYQGTEVMYSGTDGRQLQADIFFGIVYYQRLRHMVADKFQVRSLGTVDRLTRQPIKGRKEGGGIRFGEMERDSLIAHGTAFLLHDRLFNCSDRALAYACMNCKSLVSPVCEKPPPVDHLLHQEARRDWMCQVCNNRTDVEILHVPFVFRYLLAELAFCNIRVVLDIE